MFHIFQLELVSSPKTCYWVFIRLYHYDGYARHFRGCNQFFNNLKFIIVLSYFLYLVLSEHFLHHFQVSIVFVRFYRERDSHKLLQIKWKQNSFSYCVIKIGCVSQIKRQKNKPTKSKVKINHNRHTFLRGKPKAEKIIDIVR